MEECEVHYRHEYEDRPPGQPDGKCTRPAALKIENWDAGEFYMCSVCFDFLYGDGYQGGPYKIIEVVQ